MNLQLVADTANTLAPVHDHRSQHKPVSAGSIILVGLVPRLVCAALLSGIIAAAIALVVAS